MSADVEQAPQEPSGTNPFQRIIGVLISPTETMKSIAAKPDWLLPLILIIVLSVVANILVGPHVDFESQMRDQAEKQDLSDAQLDQQLEFMEKFGKVMAIVTGPAFRWPEYIYNGFRVGHDREP